MCKFLHLTKCSCLPAGGSTKQTKPQKQGPLRVAGKHSFSWACRTHWPDQGTLSLSIVYCFNTVGSKVKQHSLLGCLELSDEKQNVSFPQAHMLSILVWLWNWLFVDKNQNKSKSHSQSYWNQFSFKTPQPRPVISLKNSKINKCSALFATCLLADSYLNAWPYASSSHCGIVLETSLTELGPGKFRAKPVL